MTIHANITAPSAAEVAEDFGAAIAALAQKHAPGDPGAWPGAAEKEARRRLTIATALALLETADEDAAFVLKALNAYKARVEDADHADHVEDARGDLWAVIEDTCTGFEAVEGPKFWDNGERIQ